MACTFSTVRGEKNLKDVTHYHCFGCATGFKRGAEVERHFKSRHSLELGTPPQPTAASVSSTCTYAAKTTPQPYPAATATTNQPSTHHVEHMEPSAPGTVSQPQPAQALEPQLSFHALQEPPTLFVDSFRYKDSSPRSFRQQPAKVRCPHVGCGREFHPNSLSSHMKSQHQSQQSTINQNRFLNGICVDAGRGIYLIRKQWRGVDHPVHCQFIVTGSSVSVQCSVDTCRQYTETAARSGQRNFLCEHLKSTAFVTSSAPVVGSGSGGQLGVEALDFVINTLKWLKPERKNQCMEWQNEAKLQNASLVVQFPVDVLSSTGRYVHFSVFANVRGDHYWSFENRVVVSVDTMKKLFSCKCCASRRSCMHKCIAKWAIAQWQPWMLGVQTDAEQEDPEGVEDLGSTSDGDVEANEDQQDVSPANQSIGTLGLQYPPTGEVACRLSTYLFQVKKIPAVLPLSLTVEKESYLRR